MPVDMTEIRTELQKVGIEIVNIYDLVNSNKRYPAAIPVLSDLLKKGIEDTKIKEGVIRALTVKDAAGVSNKALIEEYNRIPKNETSIRWAIGNAFYTIIKNDDAENILQIVQDSENGLSRQMFVAALGKIKSEKSEIVLIKLLDDFEVTAHALDALGRLKSKKAKERIEILRGHKNNLIRKEAERALKKIG